MDCYLPGSRGNKMEQNEPKNLQTDDEQMSGPRPETLCQAEEVKSEEFSLENMRMSEDSSMKEEALLKSNEDKTKLPEKKKRKSLSRCQLRKKRIEEALARGEPKLTRSQRRQVWEAKHLNKDTPEEAYSSPGSKEFRGNRVESGPSHSQATPGGSGVKRQFSQPTRDLKQGERTPDEAYSSRGSKEFRGNQAENRFFHSQAPLSGSGVRRQFSQPTRDLKQGERTPDEAYFSRGSKEFRGNQVESGFFHSQTNPSGSGVKRQFSQPTRDLKQGEEKRRKWADGSRENLTEKLSVEKIAVVRHDHPEAKLTEEEVRSLKKELGRRAIKSKDVRMTSCHTEGGSLVVGCANPTTKTWLEKQVQELSPLNGTQLKTGPAKSLLKRVTVSTFLPKTAEIEDTKELMEALKNQSDLNIEHWSIVGGSSNPYGQYLVFHIDDASLEKLKTLAMRPFVGCERITFKIQGPKKTE